MSRALPRPGVLIVASEFPPGPGGIGTHAHQVALGLVEQGWNVGVAAPQDYADNNDCSLFVRDQPYRFYRLARRLPPPLAWAEWLRTTRRAIRDLAPDVMVLSGMGPALSGWMEARRAQVPHVVVGHGLEFTGHRGLRANLHARACRTSARVIAVSRYTAELAGSSGIVRAPIEVIPNGADGLAFTPTETPADWRESHGLGAGPLLLTVGRVCERKGQDTVVRALAHLGDNHPEAQYALIGLAADGARIRELAEGLGVASRVHVVGPVGQGELLQWYGAADLFVLVSRPSADGDVEGYGIVVIEAALCGLPAVVSDHGGLPETVVDGETGFVVPENDPEALAGILRVLLDDPQRIRRAGVAARARAAAECTWHKRAQEYSRVLHDAGGAGESR